MARKSDEFRSQDKRKLPIFIQGELDDYGLSCVEFRVYARIARRAGPNGGHVESVPNMAKAFGVKDKTVRRALAVLRMTRLIDEKIRPGYSNLYILNDKELWLPPIELEQVRLQVCNCKSSSTTTLDMRDRGTPDDHPGHEGPGSMDTRDGTPWTPGTDEVSPSKVTPLKVLPVIQPLPRLPGSDEDLDNKTSRFKIAELRSPTAFGWDIKSELKVQFPSLSFEGNEDYYDKWFLSRTATDGIPKLKSGSKATIRQYHADLQGFLRICVENQQHRQNGNGHKHEEPYRGPVRDTETAAARSRRENCPDCNGTKSKVEWQMIEGRRVQVSQVCRHENSAG
jgi:hypothetical protein